MKANRCALFGILLLSFFIALPNASSQWEEIEGPSIFPVVKSIEIVTDGEKDEAVFIALEGTIPENLYTKANGGLYRRRAGGKSFESIISSKPFVAVSSVAGDRLFSASPGNGVYLIDNSLSGNPKISLRNGTNGMILNELSIRAMKVFSTHCNPGLERTRIYLGCGDMNSTDPFWYSPDGGISWEPRNEDLPSGGTIMDIAVDSVNPEVVCIAFGAEGYVYDPNSFGVFISTNSGANWRRIAGNGDFIADGYCLWPNLTAIGLKPGSGGETVYVGLVPSIDFNNAPGFLFKTTDRGENWEQVDMFTDRLCYYTSIEVYSDKDIPLEGDTIITSYRSSIYFNNEKGNGLRISNDGGRSFNELGTGIADNNVICFARSPSVSGRFYTGCLTSLYMCDNPDYNFKAVYPGCYNLNIRKLLLSEIRDYAAAEIPFLSGTSISRAGVYIYQLEDSRWRLLDDLFHWKYRAQDGATNFHISDFKLLHSDPSILFLSCLGSNWGCRGSGIYCSSDYGNSWNYRYAGDITSILSADSHEKGFVLAGGYELGPANEDLVISYNSGINFDELGRVGIGANDFAAHPSDNSIIFIADVSSYIWRSTDAGITWRKISEPQAIPSARKIVCGQDGTVYVGGNRGIYICTDPFGENPQWCRAELGIDGTHLGITDLLVDPYRNGVVYAAAMSDHNANLSPVVFITPDKGATWLEFSSGIENVGTINNIALDSDSHSYLHAATDNGLYRLRLPFIPAIIEKDTVIGPGVYIINSDIVIQPDISVNIQSGARIEITGNFDGSDGGQLPSKVEIDVYGELIIEGQAGSGVEIIRLGEESGGESAWGGIIYHEGSSGAVYNADISGAAFGIRAESSSLCAIRRSSISNIDEYAINISNSKTEVIIDSCLISSVSGTGIDCVESDIIISNCRIVDTGPGITYRGSGNISLLSDSISNLYLSLSSDNVCGIEIIGSVDNNPSVIIDGCYIDNFDTGVKIANVSDNSAIVASVIEHSVSNGIVIENCSLSIGSSDILDRVIIQDNDAYGLIIIATSSPVIRHTLFRRNKAGNIYVDDGCRPDLGNGLNDMGNNNIYYDDDCDNVREYPSEGFCNIHYAGGDPIEMIGNYWDGEPEFFCGGGILITEPFLLNDPFGCNEEATLTLSVTLPDKMMISPNYPNPFNPATQIEYMLPASGHVILEVYNILGQKVEALVDGHHEAGIKSVVWNASRYSSGVYFARLSSNGKKVTRKMMLVK